MVLCYIEIIYYIPIYLRYVRAYYLVHIRVIDDIHIHKDNSD